MPIDREALKICYARLRGIANALPPSGNSINGSIVDDINGIAARLSGLIEGLSEPFEIPRTRETMMMSGHVQGPIVHSKVQQMITYLEMVHHIGREILEIGTLFNSIKDDELRARAGELLMAPDHFDRVINQATLVLEHRIRTKAGVGTELVGVALVNDVFNGDPTRTRLRASLDDGEHRGYCDVFRGVFGAFRNTTHHQLTEKFSREEALRICAFIDSLLRVVEQASAIQR